MSKYDLVINGTEYSVDIVDMSGAAATAELSCTTTPGCRFRTAESAA